MKNIVKETINNEEFELICEYIKIRHESKMSQKDLADESGLSETTISRYIKKQRIPNMKAIVNIANALDLTTDELINLDERIV